jgi:4'-phosphopantetheinyl transferase
MSDKIWPLSPGKVVLPHHEVHVWMVSLDVPEPIRIGHFCNLSRDEKERAERFYFDRDRFRYIVARGVLRRLIGLYLDLNPANIQFIYSDYGKPFLDRKETALTFNVSHSGDLALLAFSYNRLIGVDVERIRPLSDAKPIAERFFSPTEYNQFITVPEKLEVEAFFNCWTRKEAYIKAIGDGLSYPLDVFDVTLLPGEPAKLLHVEGSEAEAAKWTLHSLKPDADYLGAIIAEGNDWELACWRWHTP